MTRDRDVSHLRTMAELVLAARTTRLREAADRRAEVLSQLAALSVRHADPREDMVVSRAALDFEVWAARRRSDLNLRLAEAQAQWLASLDDARNAFGRAQVLRRLEARR